MIRHELVMRQTYSIIKTKSKMEKVNTEKVQAAFQLLSLHDLNERESDAYAKLIPGLNYKPEDEPVGKNAKIIFAEFEYPGIVK